MGQGFCTYVKLDMEQEFYTLVQIQMGQGFNTLVKLEMEQGFYTLVQIQIGLEVKFSKGQLHRPQFLSC